MTKKVVIIDDSVLTLKILDSAFNNANFEVLCAKNASIALNLIVEHIPNLIITDAIMPSIGGFQLIKIIRKNEILAKIPIIVYSAIEKAQAKFYINEDRGEYFLQKSDDTDKLLRLSCDVIKKFPILDIDRTNFIKKQNIQKEESKTQVESEVETTEPEAEKKKIFDWEKIKRDFAILQDSRNSKPKKSKKRIYDSNFIKKPDGEKKEDLYIGIIEIPNYSELTSEFTYFELDVFNSKISEKIAKSIEKDEQIQKSDNDEYIIALYAKDEKNAYQRFNYIADFINSSNKEIQIKIGVAKYDSENDSDFYEIQRKIRNILEDMTPAQRVIIGKTGE